MKQLLCFFSTYKKNCMSNLLLVCVWNLVPINARCKTKAERFSNVLNMSSFSLVCFFVFCSLPDSPAEPDPENQQGSSEEPKVIPHDEVCSDCKFLSVFAKSLPFCFGALIIFRSWSFAFFCDSRTLKETLTPWPLDRKIGCLLTF